MNIKSLSLFFSSSFTILIASSIIIFSGCPAPEPDKTSDSPVTSEALEPAMTTTAIRVYGQLASFITNDVNNGGISANSLNKPFGVGVLSGQIYIADFLNNRVLYYAGTSTTATRVYGQAGDFTTNAANKGGLSADSLSIPVAVNADSSGVYIVDYQNSRVLYYAGTSTTATRVYGQGGVFTTNAANKGGLSADSINTPNGIAVVSDGVYISDTNNHRVLYYSGTSTTATRVYGQGGVFTTNTANKGGLSADSLSSPEGISADSSGLYIADWGNNRILYYAGTSTTATRVYDQGGDFTTSTLNKGGLSADSLNEPNGVAFDTSGVYIADYKNSRILYYAGTSTTATKVYGQGGSFITNTQNNGGISADSLDRPVNVTADSGRIYIVDTQNSRILKY